MLSQKQVRHIQKIALAMDHDAAFAGKSKGNKHLSRAVRIAKHLAKQTGADIALTEAGAWIHDAALFTGNDYDPKKNTRVVKKLLQEVGLTKDAVDQIAECAASHEGTKAPSSLEAKIVHDADVIEKTGILGVIRHTWKLTNSAKLRPHAITDNDVQGILTHIAWRRKQLCLKQSRAFAREMHVPISLAKAKRIVALAAPLAEKGVITEKIAQRLSVLLTRGEKSALKSQLNLSYLK